MSEWTCEVVRIEKVEQHPNADALDIVTVLGDYPVIVKRNEYKVDDLCIYLSVDTVVPDTEQFYFLCPKTYEKYYEEDGEIKQRQVGSKYPLGSVPEKYRILKAKRIRNVYSTGMIIPMMPGLQLGESVVELMGFTKAIEIEEDNIPNAKRSGGANAEKAPVGWSIPYFDIEGLRKYIACLQLNEEIVLTEKIHGSNASFCYDGERLWCKSRNYFKKFNPDDPWWDIAIRSTLEEKLSKYPNLAFFGELYGQVKGFRYDCVIEQGAMHSKIRFFDILDVKTMRYLDYDKFTTIIDELGLDRVPELYRGVWTSKEEMYKFAEGPTTLGGKHTREGVVIKPTKERFEPRLNSRMILKLIGESYSLNK